MVSLRQAFWGITHGDVDIRIFECIFQILYTFHSFLLQMLDVELQMLDPTDFLCFEKLFCIDSYVCSLKFFVFQHFLY